MGVEEVVSRFNGFKELQGRAEIMKIYYYAVDEQYAITSLEGKKHSSAFKNETQQKALHKIPKLSINNWCSFQLKCSAIFSLCI